MCTERRRVSGNKGRCSGNVSPLPLSDPALRPQGCSVMVVRISHKIITKSIHSHLHIIQVLVCERVLSQHKHSVAIHCGSCIGERMQEEIIHSFNIPLISSNRASPRNVIAGRLDPIQFCVYMHVMDACQTHAGIHTKTCVSERLIWRRRGSSGCWMMPRMRLHGHASCHHVTPIITQHMHTYLSRMTMVMAGCVP